VSALEILAVIGVVGLVIFRQVRGEPLRGKRTVVLPAILTVIGFSDLHGNAGHLQPADVTCLVIGTIGSALIGVGFGTMMRLEARNGYLWAQLPVRGLWLWVALAAWRVAAMALAGAMHANVAASSSTLLFSLGINRLAQAAVIMLRALAVGVPFAPEKDGTSFMASAFERNRSGSRGAVPSTSAAFNHVRSAWQGESDRSDWSAGDSQQSAPDDERFQPWQRS
jgi:hypothetical protein